MTAVLFGGVLAAIYAALYYFNHKTPAPEGMEKLKAECKGCQIKTCGNNPVHTMEVDN